MFSPLFFFLEEESTVLCLFSLKVLLCSFPFSAPYSSSSSMNMFWTFFATSLAKPGVPEFVLRVYNSKFFSLPWQSFYPTLHNMELMLEVCFILTAYLVNDGCSCNFIFGWSQHTVTSSLPTKIYAFGLSRLASSHFRL